MSFALVTGASKGIGKAIALELAAKGFDLLLVARSEEQLKEVKGEVEAKQRRAEYLVLDLSTPGAAQQVFEWTKQKGFAVSALANNAGYGMNGAFESYPLEQHLNMLNLNCAVLVQLCHLFLPELKKQPQGYILNIASSAAYQPVPYLSLYAASKALVLRFSRGLRFELRKTGVSVTCVCPGVTDTGFNARAKVGPKALKTAQKVMMTSEAVGKASVDAMLAKRKEVLIGAINKLGGFAAWLLPQAVLEQGAGNIYE